MRICYVAVDVAIPHFRGASTHVYEVAKNLSAIGHEVHLISRRVNASHAKYEALDDICVHRIYRGIARPLPFSSYRLDTGREKTPGFASNLYAFYLFTLFALYAGIVAARIIKKQHLEIIVERETSFGAGAIASVITGRPMVMEVIGPRYSRLSLRRACKVMAYTRTMIRDPIAPGRLVLVPGGFDPMLFRPDPDQRKQTRDKLGVQDSLVVGYIGTFQDWHGVDDLIFASREVIGNLPSTKFLMVGPYFARARDLTMELGLSSSYIFTGSVPYRDVPRYVNASDILLAPYNPAKSELRKKYGIGFPLKILEYMACGKPVVATSVEPINRLIQDRVNGVLVPAGNKEVLASVLIELAENPRRREAIGAQALQTVKNHYSWRRFAEQLEAILNDVLISDRAAKGAAS